MKKLLTVLLMAACLLLSFGACQKETADTPPAGETPADGDYVYSAIDKQSYTWGTSGTSGTHYIVAVGIANAINDLCESSNFVVQSTAGATENLSLMLDGEMDFGYVTSGSAYYGYYQTDYMADRVPAPGLYMAVMTTHRSTGHMLVSVASGIKSYEDLAGKNISTGTTSVEGHVACETLLAAYGYDIEKDLTTTRCAQDEAITRLQDGDLDGVYLTAGYPIAAFTNLIVANPGAYTLISPDQAHCEAVLESLPFLKVVEIPAGTYPGVDFPVTALSTAATVITPVGTPAAVTYELAKYTYEHWSEIQAVHAALLETDANGLAAVDIPIHPGALAFFKEAGVVTE